MGLRFRTEDAVALLGRTPDVLRALLEGLPERWLHADEGQDSFSPYEVIGHLIHGERTDWMPRLRIILEEGEARPFDPFDRFAHRERGRTTSLSELLTEFDRLRSRNLTALESVLEDGFDRTATGTHPELGRVTAGQLLATWVVHDLGHVRQIARTMARQYESAVGPWRPYLPVLDAGDTD